MNLNKVLFLCLSSVMLVACNSEHEYYSDTLQEATVTPNVAPTITGATVISQEEYRTVGDVLTATYNFKDTENDPEGDSQIQWYRVYDSDNGFIYSKITGATGKTYQLSSQDAGSLVVFKVTPLASKGNKLGVEVTAENKAKIKEPFTSNDPLMTDQWYLKNKGKAPKNWGSAYPNLKAGADLGVIEAWQKGATGAGVVVTVVDDGLDFTHEDLARQEQRRLDGKSLSYAFEEGKEDAFVQVITEAKDAVQGGEPTPRQRHDHGTNIAGVIAAASDGLGITGIAPKASLVGLRLLGIADDKLLESTTNNLTTRILDAGVSTVSNHSYGPDDDGGLSTQSAAEYDSLKQLSLGGGQASDIVDHVIITASGNGRAEGDYAGMDETQQHPYVISISGFSAGDTAVSYAEAGPAVLAAGATGDREATGGGFAAITTTGHPEESYNYTDDRAWPYLYDDSHRMDVDYDSEGYITDVRVPYPLDNGYTASFNGTSAAAPTVAGVVALMRSVNSDLSWRDVRWILAQTARKIDTSAIVKDASLSSPNVKLWSEGGNKQFGKFSHHLGYGAVNADAAVKLSQDPNYVLLPNMKQCTLTNAILSNNKYTISTGNDVPSACPSIIEFVQIEVEANANVDASKFNMHLMMNNKSKKVARLFSVTDCHRSVDDSDESDCVLIDKTIWRTGTTAFMGDQFNPTGKKSTFTFSYPSISADNQNTQPKPLSVTVYGF